MRVLHVGMSIVDNVGLKRHYFWKLVRDMKSASAIRLICAVNLVDHDRIRLATNTGAPMIVRHALRIHSA